MSRVVRVSFLAVLSLSIIGTATLAQTLATDTHVSGSKWKAQGRVRQSAKGSALAIKTLDTNGRLVKLVEPDAHGKLQLETDFTYDDAGHLLTINQLGLPGDTPRVRSFTYDAQGHVLSSTSPEGGTVTYTYDGNGNIATKTDALGHIITYTWNASKQLTKKQYSTGSPAAIFDISTGTSTSRSYLDTSSGHLAERDYGYDANGKLINLTVSTPTSTGASTYMVGFQYDATEHVASITYPDGRIVNQSWAANGLLRSIADDTNLFFSNPRYIPASRHLHDVLLGNGVTLKQVFNKRGRLRELSLNSGGTLLLDKLFHYNHTGSAAGVTDQLSASDSMSYRYDELGRIRSVSGAASQDFLYDAFGNRGLKDGGTVPQRFDAHNRFDPSTGVTYDDAGEVTFDGTHGYAYDAEGLIVSVDNGVINYQYDAEGNRIQKTLPDGLHDYIWYAGHLLAEYGPDGTWIDYIYAGDVCIASVTTPAPAADGTVAQPYTTYLITDPLGTTRVSMAQDGTFTAKGTFAPFGDEISTTGPTAASNISYSDEVHDSETGLDTYQYRSYSPKLGRWMSPDPSSLHFGSLTNSQSFNLYSFVVNDPLRYIDKHGLYGSCETVSEDYTDWDDEESTFVYSDPGCVPIGYDPGGGGGDAGPADPPSDPCPVDTCIIVTPDPPCNAEPCVVNVSPDPDPPLEICDYYGCNNNNPDPSIPYVPVPPPPDPPQIVCSNVLPAPAPPADNPQASVDANVAYIQSLIQKYGGLPDTQALNTWLNLVQTGGPWDYKRNLTDPAQRQAAADFGNYNFGSTCSLFFSSTVCQYGAGAAGKFVGPSANKYDIPTDNYYVIMGYQYAACKKP